jgi:hypothetical protein
MTAVLDNINNINFLGIFPCPVSTLPRYTKIGPYGETPTTIKEQGIRIGSPPLSHIFENDYAIII